MAASTDKFSMTSNGGVPVVAHANATRATGVTTLSLDASTNWPTGTGIKFAIYKVNTAGAKVSGSQRDWKGTLSGTTISNMVITDGIDNVATAVGDIVVMMITAAWGEDVVEGIAVHANQDGSLKQSSVISAIGTGGITDTQIAGVSSTKFSNPYKFSVTRTSAWVTPSNTYGQLVFNNVLFDTSSSYSTSTGNFTAPVAGFYWFNGAAFFGATSNCVGALYKNGTVFLQGPQIQVTGNSNSATASGLIRLAANDTIGYYIYTDVSVAGNIGGLTAFQGLLVSTT